jgi:hypothetical protein
MLTIRLRSAMWFASGLAVALLAVAVFTGVRARAAAGDEETTFVPITPCRLFDTRAGADNVGPRDTPIGPDESHTQQVTGTNGSCTVPADATGIALNVTATNPTEGSFLTIYPSDAALPNASNVNFLAGQSPTPNKVDVKLSASGAINVFNKFGNVNVLADVAGYYTPVGLNALEARLDALEATVTALEATMTPAGTDSMTFSGANFVPSGFLQDTAPDFYNVWAKTQGDRLGVDTFGLGCILAPVSLPSGVTVTDLDFTLFDTSTVIDLQMTLFRDRHILSNETIAATTASNTSGTQTTSEFAPINHVVDNQDATYVLYSCGYGDGAQLRLLDVKITFTYPS